MNREAEFWKQAQIERVPLNGVSNAQQALQATVWIKKVAELSKAFQIEDFPEIDLVDDYQQINPESVIGPLYAIESYLAKIQGRNVFELNAGLIPDYVVLDDNWKQKVTTYISHIRNQMERVEELDETLRQNILTKLTELQQEVDRNRTRVQAAIDTLVMVTEGMGQGAKNLEPVARLIQRVTGSLTGLQKQTTQAEQLRLPPPEELGLGDPADQENGDGE